MDLQPVIDRLSELVACDTQNPPRRISVDSGIFRICESVVHDGFDVRTWDHGDGHVSWLAVRGRPRVLFNVHLDTVPVGEGWKHDPHQLCIEDGRAYGRGACDIKGAAAVLLTIAAQQPDHLALLFTTDEEGAGGCCVENFIRSGEASRFDQVIVAEPTGCRAVLGHRGFLSVKTWFHGAAGHSSEPRALDDNALHQMARWADAALGVARSRKTGDADPGACMNIGIIKGGTKSNVIAGEAFVHWSARLRPGESNDEFLGEIQTCVPAGGRATWEVPFAGEPLPAGGQDDRRSLQFCDAAGLVPGNPVDFWTEASLFSAAGIPAIVLGPGHIAQAHQADEWVALDQLQDIMKIYRRVVQGDG